MLHQLPAVANADADADARRPNADAGARTIVPVAIGAALVIALARHGVVGISHDDARAATAAIAVARVIADESHFLNELGAGVFAGRVDVGGLCAARRSQGPDAGQQGNRNRSHRFYL